MFLVPERAVVPPDAAAVVIDVLRATTTLVVALAHGAGPVLPAETVEEALRLRDRTPGALLCGEREGRKVEGFDLGNSPEEYRSEVVADRPLVFASTNGSRAMVRARAARCWLPGSFVNASAVVEALVGEERVAILCAGNLGRPSLEDLGCAGLLCARMAARGATLDGDAARLASTVAPHDARETQALVEGSSHGRYLRLLGGVFVRDVDFAAGLDRIDRAFRL